jgi:hypothetical protein
MGAAAGAGGSDKSDERKVDTYADQLKKEQARKSKTKKDKFGYTVKKSIFERIGDNHPVIQGVKNVSDKMNLNRRMKFANKVGVNIQGLSTEQILSKDFKSQLEAKGYKTSSNANIGGNDNRDSDNQNKPDLKIGKFPTPPGGDVVPTLPYEPSSGDDETKKKYDPRKIKKKGRSENLLTSARGVTKATADYSLGKKSLLGQVV